MEEFDKICISTIMELRETLATAKTYLTHRSGCPQIGNKETRVCSCGAQQIYEKIESILSKNIFKGA